MLPGAQAHANRGSLTHSSTARCPDPQVALRKRWGIHADSKLEILAAEKDMYVARITGDAGPVVLKLGPRYDMGSLMPKKEDGWEKAVKGLDFAVWEKVA